MFFANFKKNATEDFGEPQNGGYFETHFQYSGYFLEKGKLKMFGKPQSGIVLANIKGGNRWPQHPLIFGCQCILFND